MVKERGKKKGKGVKETQRLKGDNQRGESLEGELRRYFKLLQSGLTGFCWASN